MEKKIKLVIFDLGDTLMKGIEYFDAIDKGIGYYMIKQDLMYLRSGFAIKLFKNVRKLFLELSKRGIYISIASLNVPDAWKWLEKDLFALNYRDIIRYPITDEGDSYSDIKGHWVKEIIEKFNSNEFKGKPIQEEQVIFVDDLIRNHRAVNKICPDVYCMFPTPFIDTGMLSILEAIDEIEEE